MEEEPSSTPGSMWQWMSCTMALPYPWLVVLVVVARVAAAGARNAGLLAARILGAGEGERAESLRASMRSFQKDLRDVASAKGAALAQRVSEAR